jgi:hypothetical protein
MEVFMADRRKEIYECSMNILKSQFTENMRCLATDYLEESSAALLLSMQNAFENAIALQRNDQKGEVHWICLSILRSSVLTGEFKLHIGVYDEMLYLDNCVTDTFWSPKRIARCFTDDIAYLRPRIKRQLARVQDYEIREFDMEYALGYFTLAGQIFQHTIPAILELPSFVEMRKSNTVQFTFGKYMDEGVELYDYRSEVA